MTTQSLTVKSTSTGNPDPGGLAIFCFIVGAPHIYGVMQSHQRHPELRHPGAKVVRAFPPGIIPMAMAMAGLASLVGLYWLIGL